MSEFFKKSGIFICLGLFTSCLGAEDTPEFKPKPVPTKTIIPLQATYDSIKANIFEPKCMGCHNPEGVAKRAPLSPEKALLDLGDFVSQGNPEESSLVLSISPVDGYRCAYADPNGLNKPELCMPKDPVPSLSAEEIKAISDWIKNLK